jgi:predicted PurR-regulated permease PerM
MNIKKGMERIALVIAIVAIVPGFIQGFELFKNFNNETPEYKAYQKEIDDWNKANEGRPYDAWLEVSKPEAPWPKYKDRPIRQFVFGVLGGAIYGTLSFFIVLFGIRGTRHLARGTRHLAIWIVAGFRTKD